jgi:hypothetical protein
MTHELLQNPTLGVYASAINPGAINPLAGAFGGFTPSPLAGLTQWGQQGYPGSAVYGQVHPLQLAALAQATQAAQLYGQQNPLQTALYQQQLLAQAALQNPYAAGVLQNILATGGLQNPYLQHQNPFVNPALAQQYGGMIGPQVGGLQHSPSAFTGTPYGQINPALAPQSWVGQGGHPGGQINPFIQQLATRQFTPGASPWLGM